MFDNLRTHEATHSPRACEGIAEMSRQMIGRTPMTAAETAAHSLIHCMAIELAAALRRIESLERQLR